MGAAGAVLAGHSIPFGNIRAPKTYVRPARLNLNPLCRTKYDCSWSLSRAHDFVSKNRAEDA